MVFAANGATVVDGRVLVARFRHPERAAEAEAYLAWFGARGYTTCARRRCVNEGEGDYLVAGDRILAGTGFRTDRAAHEEVAASSSAVPVVSLTLVDPRFYHLDTALAVLDHDEVMYYPAAFSAESREIAAASCTPTRSWRPTPTPRRSASTPSPTAGTSSCRRRATVSSSSCATRVRADRRRPVRAAEGRRQRQVLHAGAAVLKGFPCRPGFGGGWSAPR